MRITKAKIEIVHPRVEILTPKEVILDMPRNIELAGRTCYKSESRITPESSQLFIKRLIDRGHLSVLEHCSITVKFTGSRSFSHQLVRHRIAAYSQESQRYCDYSSDKKSGGTLKIILPPSIGRLPEGSIFYADDSILKSDDPSYCRDSLSPILETWLLSRIAEYSEYLNLRSIHIPAEDARECLPNAVKTEVVTTYNLRQWRHFFKVRCDSHAQWQIRGLAKRLLEELCAICPILFKDQLDNLLKTDLHSC